MVLRADGPGAIWRPTPRQCRWVSRLRLAEGGIPTWVFGGVWSNPRMAWRSWEPMNDVPLDLGNAFCETRKISAPLL